MDTRSDRHSGVVGAFWLACGLAIAGGLAQLVYGGTSNRIVGVIIPFGVAALAFALNALIHHQGRAVATLLYFVSGIAIVYGILWMITVPLQLAVVGTCPAPPETCQPGQLPALTAGEASGLTAGVGLGLLAVASGFVGLSLLYRRSTRRRTAATAASPPAARSRPPMTSKASVAEAEPTAAPEAPAAAAAPTATTEAAVEKGAVEPAPASEPEEMAELPAHEEPLELPAPDPEPPAPGAALAPPSPVEAPARPSRKPRVRRASMPRQDPPTPPEPPSEPGSA